jgi:8-oxo-dGTP pyrophosphatase MutT (NUDIX family)
MASSASVTMAHGAHLERGGLRLTRRIRVTLLIPNGDALLLARESAEPGRSAAEVGPDDETIWQLPGGGLDPGESICDCAVREAREETGLVVEPQRIVYLREYYEPARPYDELAVWLLARVTGGRLAVPPDEHVIELRYLSRAEASAVRIVHWHDLPELWEDLTRGFPAFRHLGVQRLEKGIRTSRTTFPG